MYYLSSSSRSYVTDELLQAESERGVPMATDRLLEIERIRPCQCAHHAWATLQEREGAAYVRVRVSRDLLPLFRADEAGAGARRVMASLVSIVAALGCEPRGVVVTPEARHVAVRLRLLGDDSDFDAKCEPGVALFVASESL